MKKQIQKSELIGFIIIGVLTLGIMVASLLVAVLPRNYPSTEKLSYEEMEEVLFCLQLSISAAVNGIVWFTMVDEHEININYVNLKNRPRGEDL